MEVAGSPSFQWLARRDQSVAGGNCVRGAGLRHLEKQTRPRRTGWYAPRRSATGLGAVGVLWPLSLVAGGERRALTQAFIRGRKEEGSGRTAAPVCAAEHRELRSRR